TLAVNRATASFTKHTIYRLPSQERRAAGSEGAPIAAGSKRKGRGEFRRFLDISLGSLAELSYLLRCAKDMGFIAGRSGKELEARCYHAGEVTWKLCQSLGLRFWGSCPPCPPCPPSPSLLDRDPALPAHRGCGQWRCGIPGCAG